MDCTGIIEMRNPSHYFGMLWMACNEDMSNFIRGELLVKNGKMMRVCVCVFLLLFLASGCKVKISGNDIPGVENKSAEYGADYSGPLKGNDELVWDEKAMFGLKQPDGVIKHHFVELTGHCYILTDMSEHEIKATIQAIKDLGFTYEVDEAEYRYSGYHEKYTGKNLSLSYSTDESGPDEVWITSFQ